MNSTHVQQHSLDFADALVQSVKGPLDRLEDPLILLQGHQPLLHQLAQRPFARLMTLELRVEQRIRMDQREYRVADFLISGKAKKRSRKDFRNFPTSIHQNHDDLKCQNRKFIYVSLAALRPNRSKPPQTVRFIHHSTVLELASLQNCLRNSNVCLFSQKNIDM